MMVDLVLGSGSPRRAALLKQVGLTLDINPPDVDGTVHDAETPIAYVERVCAMKFAVAAKAEEQNITLCADTIVVLDGQILGKPRDEAHSLQMLQLLLGKVYKVITAVKVGRWAQSADQRAFWVETNVKFRELTKEEISAYWQTGEPRDKAGSYGIQAAGAMFVERIEGSFSNVIGLPLVETVHALRRLGVPILGVRE